MRCDADLFFFQLRSLFLFTKFTSAKRAPLEFTQLARLRYIKIFRAIKLLDIGICSDTMRGMNTFHSTEDFDGWLAALKDWKGAARIVQRIRAAEAGNFGDCGSVGEGVSELRIHFGPGYRAYFTRRGEVVYLLLLGGDKSTQKRDIKRAMEMARILKEE